MALASVLCLSLSTLGFELLLTRSFSVAHGNHLSFLVIGIAMLGTAAGGTVASVAGGKVLEAAPRHGERFALLCLLGSLATIASSLLVRRIPLDYLRFPFDGLQPVYLLASSLLLSLPFFTAGLASCRAYTEDPGRSWLTSCAAMLGSGAGVLLPAVVLPLIGEGGSVAAVAAAPLLPVLFLPGVRVHLRAAGAVLAAGLAALLVWGGSVLAVEPSPYKSLPQLLAAPGGRVLSRSTSLLGRVELAQSPSLRFAPGLSLSFSGVLPPQEAIVVDGDEQTVIYGLDGAPGSAGFAASCQMFAGFALAGSVTRCLIVERDGGLAPVCAAAAGAEEAVVLVENPRVASLLREGFDGLGISVHAEGARPFLARDRGSWDVIAVESWGSSVPGLASLARDFTLTTDAFRAYWRRLGPAGVLSVSRRLVLPPSDSVRIFAAAAEALRREGVLEPARHLAVVRSWDICSILVSRLTVEGSRLARLEEFADGLGFDLDYFPGITPDRIDRFNRYGRPIFADAYRDALGDPTFIARNVLDVAPQGDGRPYPNRFLRWFRIGEFYRQTGERRYLLLLSGELAAAAALVEAAAVCLILLVPPIVAMRRFSRGSGTSSPPRPGAVRALLFFAAIGGGYMFCEMCLLDSLSILLPGPSAALAVVLLGLLVSSAAGGLLSARVPDRGLKLVCAGAAVLLCCLPLLLPLAVRGLLPLAPAFRAAGALAAASVPGVLLGIPFPAAMRGLADSSHQRASAWAVNGCASVLAATGSALVVMSAGWKALGFLAGAAYAAAALALALAPARHGHAGSSSRGRRSSQARPEPGP